MDSWSQSVGCIPNVLEGNCQGHKVFLEEVSSAAGKSLPYAATKTKDTRKIPPIPCVVCLGVCFAVLSLGIFSKLKVNKFYNIVARQ